MNAKKKTITLNFKSHHKEPKAKHLHAIAKSKLEIENQKAKLWNAFVDSELTDITDQDCSIYPRVLPASYLPVINNTAKDITEFILKLISLPESEIKAILPEGPVRNFLLNELKVVKHRPDRLVGSFRFDMAIVGEPTKNNPPKAHHTATSPINQPNTGSHVTIINAMSPKINGTIGDPLYLP